uniref:Transmembrane protein 267 n=1 Tax=Eptatretus burgeri TaxID=7764 RepID=A0A8C4NBR5_EPTBU
MNERTNERKPGRIACWREVTKQSTVAQGVSLGYGWTLQTLLSALVTSSCLACICLAGDTLCSVGPRRSWHRALADSATHGLVAGITWFALAGRQRPGHVMFATALGMLLDVDHFLAARSLRIQDALNLSSRPPFHSILAVLVGVSLSEIALRSLELLPSWGFLPVMLLTSGLSHQIRDANRRGLWFWPFGTTPPLTYWLYVGLTAALPHAVGLLLAAIGRSPYCNVDQTTMPLIDYI